MATRWELSFLYQTRTILRSARRTTRVSVPAAHAYAHARRVQTSAPGASTGADDQQQQQQQQPAPVSFLQEKARNVGAEKTRELRSRLRHFEARFIDNPALESTVTPDELMAFKQLLGVKDQPERSDPPGVKDRSPLDDATDTDIDRILDIFATSMRGHLVQQPCAQPSAASSASTSALASHTLPDAQPEQLASSPLRAIVESQDLKPLDDGLRRSVQAQLGEIAAELEAAVASTTTPGPLALMEVCDARIFPLVEHLQLSNRGSKKPTTPRSASASSGGETPPSLALVSHLYPAALLLALRLYTTHFPASHLAFLLLPRIRACGPTSYVLGATTQFFNTLLSLTWLSRSSLSAMHALLLEMARAGVSLDEETYRVLRLVEDERADDLARGRSPSSSSSSSAAVGGAYTRGAAWWHRPEQEREFPRIMRWMSLVAQRLTEREMADVSAAAAEEEQAEVRLA